MRSPRNTPDLLKDRHTTTFVVDHTRLREIHDWERGHLKRPTSPHTHKLKLSMVVNGEWLQQDETRGWSLCTRNDCVVQCFERLETVNLFFTLHQVCQNRSVETRSDHSASRRIQIYSTLVVWSHDGMDVGVSYHVPRLHFGPSGSVPELVRPPSRRPPLSP